LAQVAEVGGRILAEAVAGRALQEEVEVVEEGTRRRVHAGEGTMGARGNSSDFEYHK
jgi:hypothetical protein